MRKREHFESYIEQAVYEVEMELIDLEDHGVTTKAQKKKSMEVDSNTEISGRILP